MMLNSKQEKLQKSMADFRVLDKVLESEGLHMTLGSLVLPPMWADNTDMKLNLTVAHRRVLAIQKYITKLLSDPVAEVILHCFLFPDRPVDLKKEIKAKLKNQLQETMSLSSRSLMARGSFILAMQKLPVLARVKAAWKPRDSVELELMKDDIVAILETSTTAQGWWEAQTSSGSTGLVPYMYVEILTESEIADFFGRGVNPKPASNRTSKKKSLNTFGAGRRIGEISDDGREDLMAIGIAVEENGKPAEIPPTDKRPHLGDLVVVDYEANLWNPDTNELTIFNKSEKFEFIVGTTDTIDGLSEAVQRMKSNQSARVFLAPNLAFGSIGFPPDVPPNAFLCYDITVKHIVEPPPPEELPPLYSASEIPADNESLRSSMMFQGLEMFHTSNARMSEATEEILTGDKKISKIRKTLLKEEEEQIMDLLGPKKNKEKKSANKPQRKLSRVQAGLKIFDGKGTGTFLFPSYQYLQHSRISQSVAVSIA
mmetsp:Transcript_15581/g.18565  ORF Transcript_15581/g.18565 Transcript_15581/m.18565 type:complete len:484 (+) Transcript_15581:159-1610(+)